MPQVGNIDFREVEMTIEMQYSRYRDTIWFNKVSSIKCNRAAFCAGAILGSLIYIITASGALAEPKSKLSLVADQKVSGIVHPLEPPDTSSPRAVISEFLQIRTNAENAYSRYLLSLSSNVMIRLDELDLRARRLLDMTGISEAHRDEVASGGVTMLLDVLGRIELPALANIPGQDHFADDEVQASWTIPHTEITLTRVDDGPRKGAFLFNPETVSRLPEFFERTKHLPLRTTLPIESWREEQIHTVGPLIPLGFVAAVPKSLKAVILDTPIWKIVATIGLFILMIVVLSIWNRISRSNRGQNGLTAHLRNLLTPVATCLVFYFVNQLIVLQINIVGLFATIIEFITTIGLYASAAWAIWYLVSLVAEGIILSPQISDESLDANLLRLAARVLSVTFTIVIMAYGLQDLGLPALGVLAGLGVGGIAIALAAQNTIENLIGGLNLYADKPIRVGDLCEYGNRKGTVEQIGMRSTKIRGFDQTVTVVPNAEMARMQITNLSRRDCLLFDHVFDLRRETTPDQLRFFLIECRKLLLSHPRVTAVTDLTRVRLITFANSSLQVQARTMITAVSYADFYGVQEDILLKIMDLVNDAGTGFAFPSKMEYHARDNELDLELQRNAEKSIADLRKAGQLPFPDFDPDELARFKFVTED
jgi:MscS family membrane protein